MHQHEIARLVVLLETATTSAAAKEKSLASARQKIVKLGEQNDSANRGLVDATEARNAAEKKLEALNQALCAKESRIQQLDEVGTKLLEHTDALLQLVKERDVALAAAKEQIKLLSAGRRKAEPNIARAQKKSEPPTRSLPNNPVTADIVKNARAKSGLMKGELDKDRWLFSADPRS